MENGEGKPSGERVRVAVNIRPLIRTELTQGCTDYICITPGEPQVQIGSHSFTFDYVFGNEAIPCPEIYDQCVAPLVDALLHGYNGTVLAYGQTGSGKTYTLGTNYNGEGNSGGIIPKVMESIFSKVDSMKDKSEFLIRVSFIEIFKEEVFDLLDSYPGTAPTSEGKPTRPTRTPLQIRETANGGIMLAGVTEAPVKTKEETTTYLLRGSDCRATGSTNMNSQSSRSHAIFTISVDQKKISTGVSNDDSGDDILSSKLHLVDLAGSERAKHTGANGMRLRESIYINKGLLALGNVISALGDKKKRKEGGHVPYRDSKLTRLLQDSLGGNCKTVMIACVSPSDTNAEETLSTLKYANRARNIQNKAVINHPMAAQMQRMHSQIVKLKSELEFYRGYSSVSFEELQILKHKISLLELSNAELQKELLERCVICDHFLQRAVDAQAEKERLIMKIEAARNGKSWNEIEADGDQGAGLVLGYLSRIQELEEELMLNQSLHGHQEGLSNFLDSDDDGVISRSTSLYGLNEMSTTGGVEISGEEDGEKELEHCAIQEKLEMELKELAISSSASVSMASQLSEAEELERRFDGRGRWDYVHSLADAKNLMNHLFHVACSSRCSSKKKEIQCKEKDSEIKELKGKVVELNTLAGKLDHWQNHYRQLKEEFALKSGRSKLPVKKPKKPKKPPGAFFIFLEDFRKQYKEKHPNNKFIAAVVGKAAGENWKSMSYTDKAPYLVKAGKRKKEYKWRMLLYNKEREDSD